MPDADGYMTDEETRIWHRVLLSINPGNRWIFEHCGKTWRVSERVPPCIICPECGNAMIGFTDNTCSITCDGCGKPCLRPDVVEFPKIGESFKPVSDGLDDRDEFENYSRFGHKECA